MKKHPPKMKLGLIVAAGLLAFFVAPRRHSHHAVGGPTRPPTASAAQVAVPPAVRKRVGAETPPSEVSPTCSAEWSAILAMGDSSESSGGRSLSDEMSALDEFRRSFPEHASRWRCANLPTRHPLDCALESFLDACEGFLPVTLAESRLSPRLRRMRLSHCYAPGKAREARTGPRFSPIEWARLFREREATAGADRSASQERKDVFQGLRCREELASYQRSIKAHLAAH